MFSLACTTHRVVWPSLAQVDRVRILSRMPGYPSPKRAKRPGTSLRLPLGV